MLARSSLLRAVLVAPIVFLPGTARAARGGPDGGGWSWADSGEPGISATVDDPGVWTPIGPSPLPDEAVYTATLSFPFTLYDVTSSTIWISSNGWISLRDPRGDAAPFNTGLPATTVPNATIAQAWDDMGGWISTNFRMGSTPDGDVISYLLWQVGSQTWASGAVEFYRNGSLKVLHNVDPMLSLMTIGIENGGGTQGTQIVRDGILAPGVSFASPYAVLFYPQSPALDCSVATDIVCPAPIAGTTLGSPASARAYYSCSGSLRYGAERVYRFEQQRSGPFQATLSDTGGRDLALFLVRDGCNQAWECIEGGGPTLDVPVLGKGSYYLVVDGATPGDDGGFTLVANPAATDCNKNGVSDRCDLQRGTSTDCNEDGRPDECGTCPVDVVFVMDTSGSMSGVATALCDSIAATILTLTQEGIEFRAFVWGITDNSLACLTDNVVAQLGSAVPGPPPPVPPLDVLNHQESWAQATAVVAGLFPWTPGARRVVVPISDEGPFRGNAVNDPGDDRDAITHAISVSVFNEVLASPISPDNASAQVIALAQDLATGTGGTWSSQSSASGGIGQLIIDLVRDACAGVGSLANAGPDQEICGARRITLDASGSGPICPGGNEYRWLDGTLEVCGTFSLSPLCDVTPSVTTTYTVEVRCLARPTCLFSDQMVATVTPGPLPPDLGNTLLSVRRGGDVVMSWGTVVEATTYNLYRGIQKGVWPGPLQTGLLPPPGLTLPDVPGPPFLYYYRSTGVSCGTLEGP